MNLPKIFKIKHFKIISIGSSIGTGLFIISSKVISYPSSGIIFISCLLLGLMVYFLMNNLGELSTYSLYKNSFSTYGSKYVDEAFGFALGWNYWYNWVITIAIDLISAQLVMRYWFPMIDGWIWSLIFLVLIFVLNFFSTKGFCKIEYLFSIMKIITIIFFFVISLLIILNFFQIKEQLRFSNQILVESISIFDKLSTMINIIILIGFSFQGIELIILVSKETKISRNIIANTINKIFLLIFLFYFISIVFLTLIIPHTDCRLLTNYTSSYLVVSPFTIIFEKTGLIFIPSFMNIIILIVLLSAGNSGMYASTRILYILSCEGKAPKFLSFLSKKGVPQYSLIFTFLFSGLCILLSLLENQIVYSYLINISATTGFIAWFGIMLCHYRFRKGYIQNGYKLKNLSYYDKFYPISTIYNFILFCFIFLGQYYFVFKKSMTWDTFLFNEIGILIFLIIWGLFKFFNKTKIISYKDMKFF
ncbi:MAG: amino acid permease [Arsenophonus sp.]|nr:MAG: amino acid permease [Arsenophonus sp.]